MFVPIHTREMLRCTVPNGTNPKPSFPAFILKILPIQSILIQTISQSVELSLNFHLTYFYPSAMIETQYPIFSSVEDSAITVLHAADV